MKSTKFLFAASLMSFLSLTAFADTVAYLCETDAVEVMGYKKAYLRTNSCETISGIFTNGEREARLDCQKWANAFGVTNFRVKVFNSANSGEDFQHKCQNYSYDMSAKLEKSYLNFISAVTYGDQYEYAGGSRFTWTLLYVDNFDQPKKIMDHEGKEQAQWLKINNQFYCGKFEENLAFRLNGDQMEVMKLSSKEIGLYKRGQIFNSYKVVKPLPGVNAKYVHVENVQAGTSYVILSNSDSPHGASVKDIKMYFSPNDGTCR